MATAFNKVTREWDSFEDTSGLSADWIIDPVFTDQELAMRLGHEYWQYTGNVISTITQVEYDAAQLAQLKATMWAAIQAERERRIYTLGVEVSAGRFHSDPTSRIQFIALAAYGNTMPTGIFWKTMTGSFVQMTPALASEIVSAIASMDSTVFTFAEVKKAELYASPDPANFDIYIGWPITFTPLTVGNLAGTFSQVTTDSVGRVISGSNPTTLSGHGIVDAVPSSNQVIANRSIFSGTADISGILQPMLARNRVGYWNPPGNANTVPGVFGITAFTAIGTATARNVATTSLATRMRRLGYPSAATAAAFAGVRTGVAQFTAGSGVIRSGSGFTLIERWVESTPAVVAGQRAFAGVSSSTSAPSNVEPSTLTNSIGIGQLSTDATQWYWIQGGSAAQIAIPVGTNIGAPGTASNTVWELAIYCPTMTANTFYLQLTNVSTGVTSSITMSGTAAQVPQSTTLLAFRHWACNNATLLSVGIDLCSLYIETEN